MGKQKQIIVKVYKNRNSGQKLVTIPKKIRTIKPGDYVEVKKVKMIEF